MLPDGGRGVGSGGGPHARKFENFFPLYSKYWSGCRGCASDAARIAPRLRAISYRSISLSCVLGYSVRSDGL